MSGKLSSPVEDGGGGPRVSAVEGASRQRGGGGLGGWDLS